MTSQIPVFRGRNWELKGQQAAEQGGDGSSHGEEGLTAGVMQRGGAADG